MAAIDIAFSCYPVTSLKRAREFYEKVLMLKPTQEYVKDDANGMIEYDIGPATLAIGAGAESMKVGPGGATVALEVDNFKEMITHLKRKKQAFLMEPYDGPICQMLLLSDPDGNKIMIHQRKLQGKQRA